MLNHMGLLQMSVITKGQNTVADFNLDTLRTFGIPLPKKSSITIELSLVGSLNGGLENQYVPLTSPVFTLDLCCHKMWETAGKAGLITANLMW
jgi:hypothetical protein